ncbi:flavodoxin family protein [Methanocorpusculum vombati]|uniref:Flavodoxin family protein n=1 Tax=Methanocorpusculum vombati TaxID=3002864 RepID=A0ABT4IQE8_9EURY|nr:flavodoxin family protein [Methanocorpusculum vombati]MCZ9320056.1 flavodoxin family protein [Methanocorpusculum sp.]MCZ0863340.1 flavodoxin family protein [Methanocorpusculum vombati]MDE2520195.1 flavodoxin family protein [Methanocorpusculum sp.]MDE2534880.1 flavodoxin family protein [Methanocorpusculum sp.]MDE2545935.1 flavodoxin family protein [Methanocorpusculum sp.]
MKHIVVISGSPRKGGNSDTLCDEFIHGAVDAGNTAEKIVLADKKIGFCTACDYCQANGGECIQDDDMAEILEKLIECDVIVLASPVYFYSVDAQMKTLIDRVYPRYTEVSGKEMYYIVTAADTSVPNMQRTIECFRGFADCLPDAEEKGIIYGTGAWAMGDIRTLPAMQQAYEMGRSV